MLSNASVGVYTYPGGLAPRPHTPVSVGGTPLSYDANGNMTVGLGGKVIAYDYANRPTSVLFAGQTTAYTYGPDGARQTKTVGASETFYAGMAEIRNFGDADESIILQPHPDFRRSCVFTAQIKTRRYRLFSLGSRAGACSVPHQSARLQSR